LIETMFLKSIALLSIHVLYRFLISGDTKVRSGSNIVTNMQAKIIEPKFLNKSAGATTAAKTPTPTIIAIHAINQGTLSVLGVRLAGVSFNHYRFLEENNMFFVSK
jgi:hypothetical protein